MKKILAILMSLIMMVSIAIPVMATETLSEDIVILYTNDIHTYIDGNLSYDVISAIKKDLQKQYKYVFLVDAGDHIQGTAYGSMDKGESIIKLMNEASYDVATLGNHEFDYNMSGCLNVIELADFPYVSANFYHENNGVRGENVLDGYVMFDCGDEKLAIIGITTPETFTKSTPAYFQDENGNFIYGISGGDDGSELCKDVQKAIDEAKADGATQIIALGHLGIDESSKPWTSIETIGGVCGLDAFIDGHSHSIVERETVKDKDEHDVLLTQTGEYFDRVGMMVIDAETDKITTDFIECEEILADDGETVTGYKLASDLYDGTELIYDTEVKGIKDLWISEIDGELGQKIGSASVVFDNYDEAGNRLVRLQETNSGDFAADALYYLFDNMGIDVDVAVMNGGGVRNTAITGDISYKTCKDMHTFGNIACLQKVTGEQLLDALEWGAKDVGNGENGSLLHVSGLTYKIDTQIPNTIKEKDMEIWGGKPEKYRVYDVKIYNKETNTYEEIESDKSYYLAGYNYTLRDLGGGFAMLEGSLNVQDYVMEDYMVLANYIQGFENGIVGATNSPLSEKYPGFLLDYSTVYGSGRIEIAEGSSEAAFDDEIWVGGIKVTAENKDDVFGDGGSVKYDCETDTLTLTDATVANSEGHGIYAYGLNLTVNGIDTDADGSNSISGKSVTTSGIDEDGYEYTETTHGCGIYSEGDGYGESGNITICGKIGSVSGEGDGILAYEDIVISGTVGNINCTGGLGDGIESYFGSVIVEKSGALSDVTSEENNGIAASKDVIIEGKAGNITGNGYAGIHTTGGEVIISGKVESVAGQAGGIEAYYSVDFDDDGKEIYTGGDVTISGTVGKISGGYLGIYAANNLNVSGSAEVLATDEDNSERRAVSAGANIVLPEGKNIISEPSEYVIKEALAGYYEDEDGKHEVLEKTVCTGEGSPAITVKFVGFVNPFEDVKEADWFYDSVMYACEQGLMNGTSETTFSPNDKLTRAMLVTVLYRLEGEPTVSGITSFSDLERGQYYLDAVCWAQINGIANGTTDTTFAPNDNITREQIAAIMHRYAAYKDVAPVGSWAIRLTYSDLAEIADYALDAVMYCTKDKLMQGKDNNMFCPKDNATRAEIAAILERFIKAN